MLRCGNLPAVAAVVNAGQLGCSNLPETTTGSECVQSNSLTPAGRITMNKIVPVINPPTWAQ